MTSAPQELTEEQIERLRAAMCGYVVATNFGEWSDTETAVGAINAICSLALKSLRSPGIEEAAKVCDSYARVTGAYTSQMFENAAEEIRALAPEAQSAKEGPKQTIQRYVDASGKPVTPAPQPGALEKAAQKCEEYAANLRASANKDQRAYTELPAIGADYCAKIIRAILSAPAPEGQWQWVPKEPTSDQLEAGAHAFMEDGGDEAARNYAGGIYRAMLQAAPKPGSGT